MVAMRNEAYARSSCASEENPAKPYRSPYEAYPFLSDSDADLRCDFEILTDRISSMAGVLASLCPERREEILRVDELVYHANPALRTHMSVADAEIAWLAQCKRELEQDADAKQVFPEGHTGCRVVLPGGSTRGAYAHVIRVEGKQMVRMLYRARQRGIEFPDALIDFANLVSGYFHALGIWLNMQDDYEETPFASRNYPQLQPRESAPSDAGNKRQPRLPLTQNPRPAR